MVHVPSLQHLARNIRDTPEGVSKELVRLVRNSPTFSYNPLFSAARDLIVLGVPADQVAEGIRRAVKRPDVRDNLLSVLPLLAEHFRNEVPSFVQAIGSRQYAVGRDLLVPFKPPLIYSVGGQLKLPWFSFWRSQPLAGDRISLFVTIVREIMAQDPDLEAARFEILDFSAPKRSRGRELTVIDSRDVPLLSDSRKREMLETFAEGFELAQRELAGEGKRPKPKKDRGDDAPPDHPDLFR